MKWSEESDWNYFGGTYLNTNQKAIEMFEQNEHELAMELFHQAVKECRDVQSLNNLAWMYLYEEEDAEQALELIQEAVQLNPTSYFPYNILGEAYIQLERWEEAKEALEKSISIQPSNEAHFNLAGVCYELGELEQAATNYLQAAGDSDLAMYSHVKCLIDLGRIAEAKEKLDLFDEEADNFIGEIEVADLYVELHCHKEAVDWFEKGYEGYSKTPDWIGRFVYALYKTNNLSRLDEVLKEAIEIKNEEIEDVMQEEVDEHWTEVDKRELIEEYIAHKNYYKQLKERISKGFVPELEFKLDFTGNCYLFGCKRHGHAEYGCRH